MHETAQCCRFIFIPNACFLFTSFTVQSPHVWPSNCSHWSSKSEYLFTVTALLSSTSSDMIWSIAYEIFFSILHYWHAFTTHVTSRSNYMRGDDKQGVPNEIKRIQLASHRQAVRHGPASTGYSAVPTCLRRRKHPQLPKLADNVALCGISHLIAPCISISM